MQIDELKNGSPDAFRRLMEHFSSGVFQVCYGFVNNRQDAEDLAQEVFIEVYRSIGQFRGDASLKTWIYRICVNKSLDFLRKRTRKKRLANLQELFQVKKRPIPTPAQQLEESERRSILNHQINTLPESQKIALQLSRFDHLTNREIAQIMALSESAVEALLHRARANLRKKLAKYFEKFR